MARIKAHIAVVAYVTVSTAFLLQSFLSAVLRSMRAMASPRTAIVPASPRSVAIEASSRTMIVQPASRSTTP